MLLRWNEMWFFYPLIVKLSRMDSISVNIGVIGFCRQFNRDYIARRQSKTLRFLTFFRTRICETFIRILFVYHEKSDFFILRLSIYQIPDGNSVLKVSMTFIPLLWTKRSHCLWWKDKFVMFLPSLCQVTNQWSLKNFFGRPSMICWRDSNAWISLEQWYIAHRQSKT